MKRIYVKVWLDRNFGDDLMLLLLAKETAGICSVYVHCPPEFSDHYRELLLPNNHMHLTDRTLREVYKFGRSYFTCVVLLGGSTLQGRRLKGCWYRLLNIFHLKMLKRQGTDYLIIGCNTGPFVSRLTSFFVKQEIRCAKMITTRDASSAAYIYDCISGKKDKVLLYPDMLLGILDYVDIFPAKETSPCLGISAFYAMSEDEIDFIAGVCDLYISETGGKVILLSLDLGLNNDNVAAKKLRSKIDNFSKVKIVDYSVQYDVFLSAFASCERIIAVRFHSAILAVAFDIPFLPICYSNKMENFLQDIGHHDYICRLNDLPGLDKREFFTKLMVRPIYPQQKWKKNAKGHLNCLKKFVTEKGD